MASFDLTHFKQINAIIERDSKDATYKFALLLGVIEISQEYSHLKKESGNRVMFPLGLLVEKWLLYYYPLIESREFYPQKNGEREDSVKKIAFRKSFRKVTDYYADRGGFSVFYNDYVNGTVPPAIQPACHLLVNDLKQTITTMPMRYLGRSVYNNEYSLFRNDGGATRFSKNSLLDQEQLIKHLGMFSFPEELFAVFQYLGSFISGDDSLIYQWAEFTSRASGGSLPVASVLEKLRTFPETDRIVNEARQVYSQLYRNAHSLECVWSGKPINDIAKLHVDHMIPFSVWKNNNLWNLLPSLESVNGKKRDMIPSPAFIDKRSDAIAMYWDNMYEVYPKRFSREINLALTGSTETLPGWQDVALERLGEKCDYLIEIRGFGAWSLP